jgi:hypothetical protein
MAGYAMGAVRLSSPNARKLWPLTKDHLEPKSRCQLRARDRSAQNGQFSVKHSPLSQADAAYHAATLPNEARLVIAICESREARNYSRMAEMLGISKEDVSTAATVLRSAGLAYNAPVRLANEYNGSALFLNSNGVRVKEAIRRRSAKKHSQYRAIVLLVDVYWQRLESSVVISLVE